MDHSRSKPPIESPRIGIDLGGTKTEVIALAADGTTLLRQRRPTPSQNYDAIVRTVADLVDLARQKTGPVKHIGVGVPGAPDSITGLIKNANTTCLIGRPLGADLARATGCEVRLENDANCFVLSEAFDGAGASQPVVFGIILGTGVGAGLCINQSLHRGLHDIAGEWGHNPVALRYQPCDATQSNTQSWSAPYIGLARPCYCGKTDCIETHLNGHGLRTTHAWLRKREQADGEVDLWSVPMIVEQAAHGDPACIQALDRYMQQLASALGTVINILDPDVVVLGGGLSNLPDIEARVQAALPAYVFNDRACTPIRRAHHGDSSGVRGAARL